MSEGQAPGDVELGLEDRRGEPYVEKPYYAFGGEGNSLKSDDADGSDSAAGKVPSAVAGAEGGPQSAPIVDESKPVASIRVRLLTGKSIIVKLNLEHTVGDLVAHINANGGGECPPLPHSPPRAWKRRDVANVPSFARFAGGEDWYLMGGFPPKKMVDFGKTIEEEGLKGGQVQQRKA